MTERKRRQNLAKCCSVSLQSWMNQWKLLESEQSSTSFGKKSSNYSALKYGTCLIFPETLLSSIQSGLKLYNFTKLAAGVETEQVCNLFAQRSHHVRVSSNWRQNKFELEEVISMQLRSKITVVRNVRSRHHSLLNAKCKTAVVLGLEVANGMVSLKTTFKQLEKRFNSVYMASDFYLSIWTCWNTELQRVQVNQCQFCVLKAKKISPFLLGRLPLYFFSTWLDCFMIFAPTRHECVTVFIVMLLPHFTVFYFMSSLDILKWKAFLRKPTVFNFNDVTWPSMKEINCKHDA